MNAHPVRNCGKILFLVLACSIWAATPSAVGATVNGSLTTSDAPSHARSISYADYYALSGSGSVTITMTGFDTYLYLYNSSRQQVAANDDGAGSLGSRITYTLQSGQTYYIEATSYGSNMTGNYALSTSSGSLWAISDPWSSGGGGGSTVNGALSSSDAASHARSGSYADCFTLAGSGSVTITMTGFDTYLYVYNSSLQQVASNDDGADNGGSRITYTLQSGQTYYVEATSYGSGTTGSYTLTTTSAGTVSATSSPWGSGGGGGSTVNGSLSSSDAASHTRSGSYADYFTFTGSGSVTISMTGFDTYLYVYNSNLQLVTADDDSAGNGGSRITCTLQSGQTYYIEATSYGSNVTGNYALTRSAGSMSPISNPWGSGGGGGAGAINGSLSSLDARAHLRSGCYADFYQLTGSGSVTMTMSGFDTYLYLYDSNLQAVAADDDSAGGLGSRITYTLQSGQTYYVEATSYGSGTTGNYTLVWNAGSMSAISDPWGGGGGGGGGGTSGSLSTSDASSRSRSGCRADYYTLTGSGSATITMTGFDTYLYLYDSNLQHVASNDDGAGNGGSRITYTLQSGQTYYIEATSYSPGATGSYTLTASGASASATSNPWVGGGGGGSTINGALSSSDASSHARPGAYADYYTLTGSGSVTITMTGFDTYLYVYNSSLQQVASNDDSAGNLGSRITYTLQSGQTYYVEATSYAGGGTGNYTLTTTGGSVSATTNPWSGGGGGGGGGDSYEPDNTAASASTISLRESQLHSIHAAGDFDWVTFTLAQTTEVVIVTSGSSGDTEMRLYGPNSTTTQVAYNDDSGPGLFSRIERRGSSALTPGTYYVKIGEYGNNGTIAAYTLSLRTGSRQTAFFMGKKDTSGNRIAGDSFAVVNTTGTCLGMAAYAKWYFETRSGSRGPLYPKFTLDQQRQIATQGQADIDQQDLNRNFQRLNRTDYEVGESIIQSLDAQNVPRILLMGKTPSSTIWLLRYFINYFNDNLQATHAVLVTGYEEAGGVGTFQIYNNWHTDFGSESSLTYSNSLLSNFSNDSSYVEFEDVDANAVYASSTFTTQNYPTP